MNDRADSITAFAFSREDTANRAPPSAYPNIFLPKRAYEALPFAYMTVGILFILGAAYIGVSHVPTVGYLVVGLFCSVAGVTVKSIRRRERSKKEHAFA